MNMAEHTRRVTAPGPKGQPFMGNLAEYKQDPINMLLRLQQNYGDVARNPLGPFLTHALAHPDQVQYVLQDNQRNYCRGRFYDNFKLFFGDGLLTTDGDFWLRHRRTVQPLFHKKDVFAHTQMVGDAVSQLVARWQQLPPGQVVEVVDEMMALSMHVLGLMVFNVDISRHAKTVGPAVRFGLQAMMPQGNLNDFLPRWLPTPFNLRIQRARKGIDAIIGQIIEDHRQGHCATSDVISLMLAARHPVTGEAMTDQEVHDEVMTVFLAGHETTGSGLSWGLYALAQYPQVLQNLRDELDAKLGGRAPNAAELADLPYLDQVVNEILRVYPPIWGFTRDLVADDEIGGFHIPAGSSVFVSPYVTHRHPEFWSNPEAFNPDNFDPHGAKKHKFAYFPFGGGMRKCIGIQTALLQMRMVIALMAQHFDFNALPGHPIVRGALISLRPVEGIKLIIKPRVRAGVRGQTAASTSADTIAQGSAIPQDTHRLKPVGAGCPFHQNQADTVTAEATLAAEGSTASAVSPPKPAPVDTQASSRADSSGDHRPTSEAPAPAQPAARLTPPESVPARRFTWFASEIEPLPDTPCADLAGKRILIVNGQRNTAERVASALARACARAEIFWPQADEDPQIAAHTMVSRAGPFDGIIDLTLETTFALDTGDTWAAPMQRSLAVLQANYAQWLDEQLTTRLFYLAVTWMDGCMGYSPEATDFGQPLGGLWSGLAKTLPQELPNCNIRVLDLAPEETISLERHIVAELYRWGLFEVGYAGGRRYTLQAQRAELPVATTPPLAPGDVVLFSGGARGIGLLCARALAERFGARVIVTGRQQPARGDEPWLTLSEADFKLYSQQQIRQANAQRMPAVIRKDIAYWQQQRALRATLDELAASGLSIEYRVCDVTNANAVRELCHEFGDQLRLVVHNAGVDMPVRLASKKPEHFLATINTKVLGFMHFCQALGGRRHLVQFCNVGSLTGRWGGMTGETDYAAANEALARLGLWAARQQALMCPVKTLVWPTWEEVGMITNFDVTKRYVTPMSVADGVAHWLRELADNTSGEVMFMGAVGRALTPIQIKGFSPIFGLPNIAQLVTRHHHSGQPQRFLPSGRFVTRYLIDPREAPFLQAFRLDGQPALPPALLLEHACGLGDWVGPEGFQPVQLAMLVNITINLRALLIPAPVAPVVIASDAVGYWLGADWQVDVCCRHLGHNDDILRLTLVYREGGPSNVPDLPLPTNLTATSLPKPVRAQWYGQVLRGAIWQRQMNGRRVGQLPPVDAADIWALPHPPELRLPVNHIENAIRLAWSDQLADESQAQKINIEHIRLGRGAADKAEFLEEGDNGSLCVTTANGQPVIVVHGLKLAIEAGFPDRATLSSTAIMA